MASATHPIERELAAVEEETAAIARDLYEANARYLAALGAAVQRQLVLASYHLCTHSYPEAFLALSPDRRQQLQRNLRQIARRARDRIVAVLDAAANAPPPPDRSALAAALEAAVSAVSRSRASGDGPGDRRQDSRPDADDEEGAVAGNPSEDGPDGDDSDNGHDGDDGDDGDETTLSLADLDPDSISLVALEEGGLVLAIAEESDSDEDDSDEDDSDEDDSDEDDSDESHGDAANAGSAVARDGNGNRPGDRDDPPDGPPETPDPRAAFEAIARNPERLILWQQTIQKGILAGLQQFSHKVNRALHQASVLPRKLPGPLLDMAAKAEMGAETPAGSPPNLLDVNLESSDGEGDRPQSARFTALHLRLSDLEFADAELSARHQTIRNRMQRLMALRQRFRQLQRKLAVARAEAAWRSTWFDEE